MTVKDLIEQLQKLPADLQHCRVVIPFLHDGYNELAEVSGPVKIFTNRHPSDQATKLDKYAGQFLSWNNGQSAYSHLIRPTDLKDCIILTPRTTPQCPTAW